jgi:signal peptidase I
LDYNSCWILFRFGDINLEITRQVWELEELEWEGMAWPPDDWERDGVAPQPFPPTAPAPTPPVAEPAPRWGSARNVAREIVEPLVLTVIIFLVIRLVVQNFRIEGYSMEPTLHQDQFLIVNKLLYQLPGRDPERGDIVVFEYPRAPDRDFIKRVIGLPGDTVEVRQGQVFINDQPIQEPYISAPPTYSWGPRMVSEGEYFVLGDNRNNSSDSHTWGFLPKANIIGKAWVSYWPPQHWGLVPDSGLSFASGS